MNIIDVLNNKLGRIRINTGTGGGLGHAMCWVEKTKWANEALTALYSMDCEPIAPIREKLMEQIVQIAEVPHTFQVQCNLETRMNHHLIWFTQMNIAKKAHLQLIDYVKTIAS
ncbi:hypothetical protein QP794_23940 [Paenibacillus sp. UMB7766-LJ446]|uniref:hypothetical protein n=1 Tax=Paenibacillus sp. UMB7766-LJ446 TaxID=3046313 RepID=UPI0025515B5D|nr:hypothetical protein [Paenibacillus sp. UMB7766-LJ446]MDK8193144.1 hypothetical protein [Paenibacillus sp. UMB7766-LJ446]